MLMMVWFIVVQSNRRRICCASCGNVLLNAVWNCILRKPRLFSAKMEIDVDVITVG